MKIKNSLDDLIGLALAGAIIGGITIPERSSVKIYTLYEARIPDYKIPENNIPEWGNFHAENNGINPYK